MRRMDFRAPAPVAVDAAGQRTPSTVPVDGGMTTSMLRSGVVSVGIGWLLLGCSGPLPFPVCAPTSTCLDLTTVTLTHAPDAGATMPGGRYQVTWTLGAAPLVVVCDHQEGVGSSCTLPDGGSPESPAAASTAPRVISLSAKGNETATRLVVERDGRVVFDNVITGTPREVSPNGRLCSPTCTVVISEEAFDAQ